jgi:hypothetical protein
MQEEVKSHKLQLMFILNDYPSMEVLTPFFYKILSLFEIEYLSDVASTLFCLDVMVTIQNSHMRLSLYVSLCFIMQKKTQ